MVGVALLETPTAVLNLHTTIRKKLIIMITEVLPTIYSHLMVLLYETTVFFSFLERERRESPPLSEADGGSELGKMGSVRRGRREGWNVMEWRRPRAAR